MLSLIAAVDEKSNIGKNGKLPWHIPEDFRRFKMLTMGKPIIMGRKTFDSIGKPLPGRTNIVITRQPIEIAGVIIAHSLNEAVDKAKETGSGEIFIIGGQQIYELAMPFVDKIYLTIAKGDFSGDAQFPDYSEFKKVTFKENSSDQNHQYTFLELVR